MARRDAGDTEAADALLRALAASHPGSPYAAEARRAAAAHEAAARAAEGERVDPIVPLSEAELRGVAAAYRAAADASAGAPRGRDALYNLAVVLDNLGDVAGAVSAWEEFLRRYPDDERVPEVLYGLAYIHQVTRRDVAAARRYYRRLLERYPGTRFAVDAEAALRDLEGIGAAEPASPTPPTPRTPPGDV
jgi:TolA-binding protein